MKVAIAAGGTAGHINPALALAEELRERGHEVVFVGQTRRLEATLVPEAGFPLVPIEVSGFDRSRPWTLITAVRQIFAAQRALEAHFSIEGAPDAAIGFGAYVELPLMRWCAKKGIPYLLHEQNSVAGLANKVSSKGAAAVCIAFPQAEAAFSGKAKQIVVTGNPVRKSVVSASREDARTACGLAADEVLLLVFGGSLGARHINQAVCGLKGELLSRPKLRILHSTGKDEYNSVVEALALTEDEAARWTVAPYIDDMGAALAAADCVLSRAGASSVAEIAARAVPSLLIPYPFATADHQTVNAHLLVDAGAADMLGDAALGTPEFAELLFALTDNASKRALMRDAAASLGAARAAQALADCVEKAVR